MRESGFSPTNAGKTKMYSHLQVDQIGIQTFNSRHAVKLGGEYVFWLVIAQREKMKQSNFNLSLIFFIFAVLYYSLLG